MLEHLDPPHINIAVAKYLEVKGWGGMDSGGGGGAELEGPVPEWVPFPSS